MRPRSPTHDHRRQEGLIMATFREAYIQGNPNVTSLFAKPMSSLMDTPPESHEWDTNLVQAIRDFNAYYDHHPQFEGNEAVVITGQQPAIFGGPLYSVYKAITTLKLAEKITAKHGVPCIPIFWIGSEDHDFEEAANTFFPNKQQNVQKLSLQETPGEQEKALHEVPLSEQIHELIDTLADAAIGTEFKDEIQSFLHKIAQEAVSLSDWSTHLLVKLFHNTPLVFFAPHLEEARTAAAPIIKQAIKQPLEVSRCVNKGAHALQQLGFTAQVEKSPEECAFFIELDGKRQRVVYTDNLFELPDSKQKFTDEDLLVLSEKSPKAFSPNVALRCVVQQHLFPVAAYVAGPGELTYWGQFKAVFELFDSPMPVLYPRAEAILTSLKLNQLLNRYNLTRAELTQSENDLVTNALRYITQSKAIHQTSTMREDLNPILDNWIKNLQSDSPTPSDMAVNLQTEINQKLDRLERVIAHISTEQVETVKGHIKRLRTQLVPNKKPQERVYNIYSYLMGHGWGMMDQLLNDLEIETFIMNEVEL